MVVTYRTLRKKDVGAVVSLANMIEEQQHDAGRSTVEGLEQLVSAPYIKAEEDFFVALNADDEVVGGSMMMMRGNNGMVIADVTVHPDYAQKDVIAGLVERTEARTLQRANAELADEPVVHLNFAVQDYKASVRSVLEESGYSEVRRQYVMRVALDTRVEPPQFPAEYEFRAFDQERDAKRVHAVFQECFADHWGEVAQIPFEQWEYQFKNPHFDPTLWYILYHADDIAAICLCEVTPREEGLGLVEVLGVRPAFRKHGLGGLLLRHAFYQFQQGAYQHVALDVDTENTTNAVALYEKAGMHIYRCTIAYRKVLRGNPDDIEE